MEKKPCALITGASSGIGEEIARIHASRGGNLLLIARRQKRLQELCAELKEKYQVNVDIFTADLTDENALHELLCFVDQKMIGVDYLINNAGFGGHGKFLHRKISADLNMVELNINALLRLSHAFGQRMVRQGSGKIMNVASTAAFIPGPLQATYYASKAFVLSFSEALSEELQGTGVTVTALCPGPTASEFVQAADLEGVAAFKLMGAASSRAVAEFGYTSMLAGKVVAIQGWKNWIGAQAARFTPRAMMRRISRLTMEK